MANPLLGLAAAAARLLPAPLKRGLYKLGPLSRWLRAALNRAAPQGLSEVSVAAGGLAGATLLLDLQSEKDYWLGTYEMELQHAIREWAKPGAVVYDLGANVGYVSLLLARAVGSQGRVFAFEPLPANQDRLRRNVELNPGLNVRLIPGAAADRSGRAAFATHGSDDMGRLHAGTSQPPVNTIEVETTALDDFVKAHPAPALVKIDVEGAEVLALQGMQQLLCTHKPVLFIELHGYQAGQECWVLLQEAGYQLHWMQAGYAPIAAVGDLKKKSYVIARAA
ncbi:MAG: FkbM family methyltransferase [Anaerolineales bacterium]|nr:FkbM family methyltransferase [Anaerolineales bacterium]